MIISYMHRSFHLCSLLVTTTLWLAGCDSGTPPSMQSLAEKGDPDAQFAMGLFHETNGEEALKWYTLAADQGHVDAMLHLGSMHANGRSVPEDSEQALRHYTRAAEYGNVNAMFWLGKFHLQNATEPDKKTLAYVYFSLAASDNHENSAYQLHLLTQTMDTETIHEAKERLKNAEKRGIQILQK